jgi:hypothetical protein
MLKEIPRSLLPKEVQGELEQREAAGLLFDIVKEALH